MRRELPGALERARLRKAGHPYATLPGDRHGFFEVQYRAKGRPVTLRVLSSGDEPEMVEVNGERWEHVSVSVKPELGKKARCPTWEEMCFVKDLFWAEDEAVIQYHPPEEVYVNLHPHTLHLWKPIGREVPVPHPDHLR